MRIGFVDVRLYCFVRDHPGLMVKEIATRLGENPEQIAANVEKLAEYQLVNVEGNPCKVLPLDTEELLARYKAH